MECTQRLECTQELYDTHTERTCPEQVGFLGICGTKYPVMRGPNKIGRDPQMCDIVLNMNSISRQHAVINILNSKEFMLMDLGSANKTKLQNVVLQSYIPHPLKNGDLVQFGDIFGLFRLLEEDNDLPMTQAIDIPETPAPIKPMTRLHIAPITLIPESPDVSDMDDSFITLTKKSLNRDSFGKEKKKSLNGQFATPFSKPVNASQRIESKQTNKRSSSSGSLYNPNTSLNESFASTNSNKKIDIHEMDTQPPEPNINDSTDSIYTADTQIPQDRLPSIHTLDTQLPVNTPDHLPRVQKINDQQEMQFDLYTANKENDISIFNAETQPFPFNECMESKKSDSIDKSTYPSKDMSIKTIGTSDEEVLLDDIDGDVFEEDLHSQAILPQELPFQEDVATKVTKIDTLTSKDSKTELMKSNLKTKKRDTRIQSDGSTDCEDNDMLPTQKIPEIREKQCIQNKNDLKPLNSVKCVGSDSSTDCEDIDLMLTQKIPELPAKINETHRNKKPLKASRRVNRVLSDSSTDCEDFAMMATQKVIKKKIDNDDDLTDCEDNILDMEKSIKSKAKSDTEVKFEDMDTQIIGQISPKDDLAFEDMPTQVIDVIEKDNLITFSKNDDDIDNAATQIIEVIPNQENTKKSLEEIISPFKIPLQASIKIKSKDIPKLSPHKTIVNKISVQNDNFYAATQDIYVDLCSQKAASPEEVKIVPSKSNAPFQSKELDDEVVPCSVEGYKIGDRFANIEKELSPKYVVADKSSSDGDERAKNYVGNLTSQQIKDIIGVENSVKVLKRVPSDASDIESTPTKKQKFKFMDFDLPNSQEIKRNVSAKNKVSVTESSSESETEENTEEQYTPIVHRKKKPSPVAVLNLTKKFDVEKLPERVITRVRKPTNKAGNSTEVVKNILKPKFLLEQEDQIDKDIIIENITRLKSNEKSKNSDVKKDEVVSKKTTSHKKSDRTKETKEKIKVKIEKPKRSRAKKNESKRENENSKISADILDSTAESSRNSRTTRSRRKDKDNEIKTEESSKRNKTEEASKGKRTNKRQETTRDSVSPEIEIRRSKRQQTAKEKTENSQEPKVKDNSQASKSILKKSTHEQSTVYNISTSSAESVGVKRSAVDDSDEPSPKRTRSGVVNTSNVSLRATPARLMKTQHVLFTAFPSEEVKQKLVKLGAVVVTDVTACTVVLTMQIKRTFKLLCAVGLGRPIVGPSWVQACVDTHMIVDPWLYLIKDEIAEKRFQFSLQKSLTGKRNYLNGYNISSTPNVQPNATEMKLIVESSGGSWKEEGPNWICVSSTADKSLWPSLRKRGATVVSTEFILGGVLRQKLDIAGNMFK